MATISKGITLSVVSGYSKTDGTLFTPASGMQAIELTNLLEIPEIGGSDAGYEQIDITTLADSKMKYMIGLESASEPEALEFKFLYEKSQFKTLEQGAFQSKYGEWQEDEDTGVRQMASAQWKITLPDGSTCTFVGKGAVRLEGVGVNSAITYVLSVTPDGQFGEFVWDFTGAAATAE